MRQSFGVFVCAALLLALLLPRRVPAVKFKSVFTKKQLKKSPLGVEPAEWTGTPFAALTPVCQNLLLNRLEMPGKVPVAGRPHRFKLPVGDSPAAMLCVPQKNGNRYWAGLSFAAVNRRAAGAMNARDVVRLELRSFHSPAAWLLTRNPYVRALSLYLDKVVANCTVVRAFDCNHTIYDWNQFGERPPRGVTFEGYMKYVYKQSRKRGDLCRVPYVNHACPQVEGCQGYRGPTYALKTEQQALWYPCMVQLLGIEDAVSTGWEEFTGGSACYHRGRSGTCHDALELPTEETIAAAGAEVNTPTEGTVHTTSAWAKLREYYTPKAAEIVTLLYAKDFAVLGYPTWDGVGEFVADYPPLHRPSAVSPLTENGDL